MISLRINNKNTQTETELVSKKQQQQSRLPIHWLASCCLLVTTCDHLVIVMIIDCLPVNVIKPDRLKTYAEVIKHEERHQKRR